MDVAAVLLLAAVLIYAFLHSVTAYDRAKARERRAREQRAQAAYRGLLFGFADEKALARPVVPPSADPQVVGVIVGKMLDAGPQAFIDFERERGALS